MTPKFCADMELGVKGMSVQTLCRLAETLHLSADYILWGRGQEEGEDGVSQILRNCSREERAYAEQMLKLFLMAMNRKNGPL